MNPREIEYLVEFRVSTSHPWVRTAPVDPLYAEVLVETFHTAGWKAREVIRSTTEDVR